MRLKPAFLLLAIVLLASLAAAQDTHQLHIVRPVDNRSVVRLQGTMHPRARVELDRGPVSGAMPMQHLTMVFSRTAAQQADLDQLLAEQQDRSSLNYHKWLTPEQFGDRFGLASQDVNLVAAWLQSQGFTVDEIARSRTWIAFSGIAAQVEAAFHTFIHNFVFDGQTHYAPSAEPSIPGAFSGVVAAISGLHDFRPRVHSRARRANPRLTSSLSGDHYLAPGDFGTIYNLPDYVQGSFQSGTDGTGQTIGIVGQATLTSSDPDNDTFRSISKLPAANFTATLAGTAPSFSSADTEEADLDIEWSGAVAPNAAILFAYSTNALTSSLPYLVNQNAASVISISYGDCEANIAPSDVKTIELSLSQANAQGQTVTAAAGDVGAADCDGSAQNPVSIATSGLAVDYPASSVYVTAMGGTEFSMDGPATVSNGVAFANQYWNGSSDPNDTNPSALSYIPEWAWNDSPLFGLNIATGGGVSKQFIKPAWQTGTGVPADGHRDVPDLALTSSPNLDGYIICSQGSCQTGYRRDSDQTYTIIGGTSAAAPTFAGIVALVNQKLGARQGNMNPQLYTLGATLPWAFNDIVNGDNKVPCSSGTPDCPTGGTIGFSAGTGYDPVTGWGSVDVIALLDALLGTPNPDFTVLPSSQTINLGQSEGGDVGLTISPREGFSGTVALTCTLSSALVEATCGFNNPSVALPAIVNFSIMPSSNRDQLGTQTGTVTIQAVSGSLTHTLVLSVTISYPDFTLTTASPTLTVPPLGAVTDVVNVQPVSFFGSDVIFSCTTTGALTCSVNPLNSFVIYGRGPTPVAVTVTSTGSAVSNGSVTFQGTYTTLTHSVQIPVSVSNSDFTLTGDGPSLTMMSGQTLGMGINISPVQSFAGSVSFSCSGSPGLTCALSPNPITASPTGPVTSILSVTSSDFAASGSVTITAASGSLTHTLQIPVTVMVVIPDFGLGMAPAALSLTSGQAGTSTITVTPQPGFNSDVALTCSVAASLGATTCSLSPTTVTGGNGISTLTIHAATLAMERSAPLPFMHRGIGTYATFVFALGMVFTMNPRRNPRGKGWRKSLLGLFLLGVMLGLVSCGGGGSGGGGSVPHTPTPLSGTVTVTGTSGTLTHSVSINVTIN